MFAAWLMSGGAAVLTGLLAFSDSYGTFITHAIFLLAVATFVLCSLWGLAIMTSTIQREPEGEPGPDSHDGSSSED